MWAAVRLPRVAFIAYLRLDNEWVVRVVFRTLVDKAGFSGQNDHGGC